MPHFVPAEASIYSSTEAPWQLHYSNPCGRWRGPGWMSVGPPRHNRHITQSYMALLTTTATCSSISCKSRRNPQIIVWGSATSSKAKDSKCSDPGISQTQSHWVLQHWTKACYSLTKFSQPPSTKLGCHNFAYFIRNRDIYLWMMSPGGFI